MRERQPRRRHVAADDRAYASWQFAKGHSVGIAPRIAYQRFKMNGLQAFAPFSTNPTNLTNDGYCSSWGVGARVGCMGQFTDQFAVAAEYASMISMGNFDEYKGLFAAPGGFGIPSSRRTSRSTSSRWAP